MAKKPSAAALPAVRKPSQLVLNWAHVAVRLATRLPAIYMEAGASADQTTDEFVIRQALREIIIDALSISFVTTKEVRYDNHDKYLDLTISLLEDGKSIAIELKGDSADTAKVQADWGKLKKLKDKKRISIYAGVKKPAELALLKTALTCNDDKTMPGYSYVRQLTRQFLPFSFQRTHDDDSNTSLEAFVYVWTVDTKTSDVELNYVLEKAMPRRDDLADNQ
jgi:hypothetical protein